MSEMSQASVCQLHACCLIFCRWTYTATGEQFAVKGLSPEYHSPDLLENEVHGLIRANKCKTPRVVKFEELIVLPKGDGLVVLE